MITAIALIGLLIIHVIIRLIYTIVTFTKFALLSSVYAAFQRIL